MGGGTVFRSARSGKVDAGGNGRQGQVVDEGYLQLRMFKPVPGRLVQTTGQYCPGMVGYAGEDIVGHPPCRVLSSNATAITTATDTTVLASLSAGTFYRLYGWTLLNDGAACSVAWRFGAASNPAMWRKVLTTNETWVKEFRYPVDLGVLDALILSTLTAGSVYWTVEYDIFNAGS